MSAKSTIRDLTAGALLAAGLTAPATRGRGTLSIATFHRVLPQAERRGYPFHGLVVTPDELDQFLTYFEVHYDCGTLATQHDRFLRDERTSRPLLAITFDDGQADNYRYARPILARHGILASFFIPVTAIEHRAFLWHDRLGFAVSALLARPDGKARLEHLLAEFSALQLASEEPLAKTLRVAKSLAAPHRESLLRSLSQAAGAVAEPEYARPMNFDELMELSAGGHEIGSHSMTHRMMPECDDAELDYELRESRDILRSRLGHAIETFCYPNGDSDARTAAAVARAGYRRAVTTAWGANGRDADPYRLRRFDMDSRRILNSAGRLDPALVALRMSGIYPRTAPLD